MTQTTMPGRRKAPRPGLVLGIFFALAALALSAYLAFTLQHGAAGPSIDDLSQRYAGSPTVGGPFRLHAAGGELMTEATAPERMTLLFFGFTHCPDVCPTALGKVAAALDRLPPEEVALVRPIFVSVDPERDTPETLADYAAYFHPALIGAVAEPGTLEATTRAYRAYYRKVPLENGDYTIDHSAILYLQDWQGRNLAMFGHGTTAETLAAALHAFALALEARAAD